MWESSNLFWSSRELYNTISLHFTDMVKEIVIYHGTGPKFAGSRSKALLGVANSLKSLIFLSELP